MKDRLKDALRAAMKAKDKIRLQTIRAVLSAVQYQEIQEQTDNLSAEGVSAILKSELKKRKEAAEFAEQAGRNAMSEELGAEMRVLESFLPKQLGPTELEKLILDMKSADPGLNLGAAMRLLKERYSGQYDGKAASEIAKRVLA